MRRPRRSHRVGLVSSVWPCIAASGAWLLPLGAMGTPRFIDPLEPWSGGALASCVNADGTVVGGWGNSAFRWRESSGTVRLIGFPGAQFKFLYGISPGGEWAVGTCLLNDGTARAINWGPTNAGVVIDANHLDSITTARDISADGATIVGAYSFPNRFEAYVWSDGLGVQLLGVLPGAVNSQAFAVSDDGQVVVGASGRAFMWTRPTGMIDLGALDDFPESSAIGLSSDGLVAVGYARNPVSRDSIALMWRNAMPQLLPVDLPGVDNSQAKATNRDGTVIVGAYNNDNRAFLWTPQTGAMDLTAYVASLGLDLPGVTFTDACGVSADGSTIVGQYLIDGRYRAFILRDLPLGDNRCPPCAADFNEDGGVTAADLAAFLIDFDVGARCADINNDDEVNPADLAAFLASFERGGCE